MSSMDTGQDPLSAVQDAIEILHDLMTVLPDPKATQIVAKCLQALTGIQQEMMQNQGQDPRAALMQQLQGAGAGGGGGMPQY